MWLVHTGLDSFYVTAETKVIDVTELSMYWGMTAKNILLYSCSSIYVSYILSL